MQDHNQLVYIQQCLLDRLKSVNDQKDNKLKSVPIKPSQVKEQNFMFVEIDYKFKDDKVYARRIREIQDQLKNVKLVNKTMNICKENLQCVKFYF